MKGVTAEIFLRDEFNDPATSPGFRLDYGGDMKPGTPGV